MLGIEQVCAILLKFALMARLLGFNALSSSERASVTAASTVSDGMQAGLFHGRKGVLHQPTDQH